MDWVAVVENLWWNCDVIHRTHPPMSVSIEESFLRDRRFVAVTAMPEPPIKEDRIAALIERITEMATGNNSVCTPECDIVVLIPKRYNPLLLDL